MKILPILLTIAFLTCGCVSTQQVSSPPSIFDLQVRMAQIRFKQFMVNLSMAASPGIKRGLESEPTVQSADVFIDYELPTRAIMDEPACLPVLVEIRWRDTKHPPANAGEMVRRTFRKAGMDQPTVTRVLSNDECTIVQGFFLVQSTPNKNGVRNLTPTTEQNAGQE